MSQRVPTAAREDVLGRIFGCESRVADLVECEMWQTDPDLVEAFADWIVLPWDRDAAAKFVNFRRQGVRIGTMDLKIACIALVHDATVLTRNATDFSQVPGLRFENWLK